MERRLEYTTGIFDIEGLVYKSLFKMSGGEKQKIACASVSMPEPDIYVLDEPTSNLDLLSIKELAGIIAKWRSEDKTVIVADHRLNYLKEVADKVVLIDKGRVVGKRKHQTFLQCLMRRHIRMDLETLETRWAAAQMPSRVNRQVMRHLP